MTSQRTNNLTYTEWFHGIRDDWNDLTREECVARFGEASIAAAEAILTQNPELTVGLHGKASVVRLQAGLPELVVLQFGLTVAEVRRLLDEIERLSSRPCPYVVQDRDGTAYCRLGAPPEPKEEGGRG